LVYGGAGALGQAFVNRFNEAGWKTFSVDLVESSAATHSLVVSNQLNDAELKTIMQKLSDLKAELSCVVHAAGGWTGGSISSGSLMASLDRLYHQNLESAVAASHVAARAPLTKGGLLVLTGASAATGATPGMVAYGITKAATHHLVASLASPDNKVFSDLSVSVVGILPITLDTPSNRSGMPTANFDDWTPVEEVAGKVLEWVQQKDTVPQSGSLVVVKTANKNTQFTTTPNPFN